MNNSALWPAWMLIACVGCISQSPNSPNSPGRTTVSWTKLNWNVGKVGLKINLSFWTKTKTQKPQSHSQGGVFVAKLWFKILWFHFPNRDKRLSDPDWRREAATAKQWKTQRATRNQLNHKGNRHRYHKNNTHTHRDTTWASILVRSVDKTTTEQLIKVEFIKSNQDLWTKREFSLTVVKYCPEGRNDR